jgi:hypothetical protein
MPWPLVSLKGKRLMSVDFDVTPSCVTSGFVVG